MTFLAFLNIGGVFPVFYLFLECSLTAGLWVPLSIATVADLGRAFGTFACFFIRIRTHHDRAFRIWTPFQIWILLNLQIPQKLPVFVVSRQIYQLSNKIVGNGLLAVRTVEMLNSHASDLLIFKHTSSLR